MGESERRSRKKNSRRRSKHDSYTSSDSSSTDTEEERRIRKKKRGHRDKKSHKSRKAERSEESSDEGSSEGGYRRRRERKRKMKGRSEHRERKGGKNDRKRRHVAYSSDEEESGSSSAADVDRRDRNVDVPQKLVQLILKKFPSVKQELRQLLKMMDDGQAVDIQDISSKSFLKLLKKLFQSLNLKRTGKGLYLLPKGASSCLEVVGSVIECNSSGGPESQSKLQEEHLQNEQSDLQEGEGKNIDGKSDANYVELPELKADSPYSKRRVIGPVMPSAEMLAAAAKLTEAEAALREAEKELENDILIGPPPPAAVAEAESANDAERFEEVTRIIALDASNPYDILGLKRDASPESIKKRYWKLSLLVHPDKCSHPEAHQAFTILNQGFKDLQDPTKRAAIDDKIILKEEREEFEADFKARCEAAQWRRLRGEAVPGDDELLGEGNVAPKRDEWMTQLPPERKPGVSSMHSTFFSKSEKADRGDASIWTDTPVEKAEKAKMHYLEAYKQAALTAGENEIDALEKKRSSATAELMDNYNKSKRSVSLVEKHQKELKKPSKKIKQTEKQEEEEWSGKHPWKPWDREADLAAGRQKVTFDANSSAKGLTSRFSSGSVERSFL
uniref:J domain-containing protein n=1 Tax=Araucaria cunninghamii TaxID=56994 RepID=A0A0D6R351_ARACU